MSFQQQNQKIFAIGAALVPGAAEVQTQLHNKIKLPFTRVPSLDSAISGGKSNRILRIEGSGPVQLILFSTGVVVTSSSNSALHGHVISFPFPSAEKDSYNSNSIGEESTKIVDIAAGESHYVAVDNRGRVYTWGWSNEYGQLGRGRIFSPQIEILERNIHEPVLLAQFGQQKQQQNQEKEQANYAGRDSSSSSSSPMSLLSKLNNNNNNKKIVSTVIEQRVPHKIIAVACGRHHTVLLTESRKCVFVFGRGHRGQLGLKDTIVDDISTAGRNQKNNNSVVVDFVSTPRSIPSLFGLPIRQICCSSASHHTLVVLESGHLIAMGENISGNLGVFSLTDKTDTDEGTRAAHTHCFIPTVVDIAQGSSSSSSSSLTSTTTTNAAGDSDNNNNNGVSFTFPQLPRRMTALIPVDKKSNQPLENPQVPVISVDSSGLHTVLVDRFGRLLTAGAPPLRLQNGEQPVTALGALGRQVQTARDSSRFGLVPEFFIDRSVGDDVICGRGFTAVLLKRHNAVFVSGAVQAVPNKSDVAVGAGVEASGWLHLELGEGFTVSQIFASGGGLLVVGEE